MTTSTSCSWCHAINDVRVRWCKACGHSALLPRQDCDCQKCMGVLFVDTRIDRSKPPADAACARIRRLLGDAFDVDDLAGDDEPEGNHV